MNINPIEVSNDDILQYLLDEIDKAKEKYYEARRSENEDSILKAIKKYSTLLEIFQTLNELFNMGLYDDNSITNPYEVDMVNSPAHYTKGKYEVVDVIKDWLTPEEFRGYIKGNTIKYVSRERYKNGDEDLFKTIFYLNYLMNGKKSDGRKDK